jgi:uncharacterized protein YoxC
LIYLPALSTIVADKASQGVLECLKPSPATAFGVLAMPSALRAALVALGGLLAAAAFAFLLKLMYDMSQSMARMTEDITSMAEDMHQMGADMNGLSEQVAAIRVGVDAMASDMRGMRASVDRMSAVIQSGGKQIEQINPMGAIKQMMPSGR